MAVRGSIVPVDVVELDKGVLAVADLAHRGAAAVGGGVGAGLAAGAVGGLEGHGAVLIAVGIGAGELQRGAVGGSLAVSAGAVGQVVGPLAVVDAVIAREQLDAFAGALAVHHLAVVQTGGVHQNFLGACRQAGLDGIPLGAAAHQPAVDIGQHRAAQRIGICELLQHHLQSVVIAAFEPADDAVVEVHRLLLLFQIGGGILNGLAANGEAGKGRKGAQHLHLALVHAEGGQARQGGEGAVIHDLVAGNIQLLQAGQALQEGKIGELVVCKVQLAQAMQAVQAVALLTGELAVGQRQSVQCIQVRQLGHAVREGDAVGGELFQLLQGGELRELVLVQRGAAAAGDGQAGEVRQGAQGGPVFVCGVLHGKLGGVLDAVGNTADAHILADAQLLPDEEAANGQQCGQHHQQDDQQDRGLLFAGRGLCHGLRRHGRHTAACLRGKEIGCGGRRGAHADAVVIVLRREEGPHRLIACGRSGAVRGVSRRIIHRGGRLHRGEDRCVIRRSGRLHRSEDGRVLCRRGGLHRGEDGRVLCRRGGLHRGEDRRVVRRGGRRHRDEGRCIVRRGGRLHRSENGRVLCRGSRLHRDESRCFVCRSGRLHRGSGFRAEGSRPVEGLCTARCRADGGAVVLLQRFIGLRRSRRGFDFLRGGRGLCRGRGRFRRSGVHRRRAPERSRRDGLVVGVVLRQVRLGSGGGFREFMAADFAELLLVKVRFGPTFGTEFHRKFSSVFNSFRSKRNVYGHSCTFERMSTPPSFRCNSSFR